MAQFPHELIRQVQIRTRTAAGLPDYNPSDPTLPALPPLSATIATAADDISAPDHRCRNCKALLLRGSKSIICLYCGLGPHHDAVPDPISFTSTVGYQWLLRSLRLDGSELVDPNGKKNQGKGQSSPKDLTPLSVFLNFKIPWPAETLNQEISSDKHIKEGKKLLILTGVAPDRFFLESKSNGVSGTPTEHPSDHKWAEGESAKDVAPSGNQDLFENVQPSKPAVNSSGNTTSRALSGWEADFQFADSEDQHGGHTSSENITAPLGGSEIKFEDPESFQSSSSLNVDLGAHLDSVFGAGENLNDEKPKESPSVPSAFGDWSSDDMWNNTGSSMPNVSEGFDATFSTKSDLQNDHTLDYSKDLSTSDDLFQDFQSQTIYADMTNNKATNEEHTSMDEDLFENWNDFASSTTIQGPVQNAWDGCNDKVSTFDDKPSDGDLFSFDSKLVGNEKLSDTDIFSFEKKFEDGHKSSEGDLFSFDDKFVDEKKSSESALFSFDNKFDDDKKSSERDLFSFDSNFGGDFTSTSNSNAPAEGNAINSEDPTSIWFSDEGIHSLESGQAANSADAFGQSSEDHVKVLISQMHDLSFMLETDISIPSSSGDHKPVRED